MKLTRSEKLLVASWLALVALMLVVLARAARGEEPLPIYFPPIDGYAYQCGAPDFPANRLLYKRFLPGQILHVPGTLARYACDGTIKCRVVYDNGWPSEEWRAAIIPRREEVCGE